MIKVMDPGLILGPNSTHKFLRVIFVERQELLRNVKPALLLIFGQHSWDPSSWDLGHPYLSRETDLPQNLCLFVLLYHAGFFSCNVWSDCAQAQRLRLKESLKAPRPFTILHALPPSLKPSSPILHRVKRLIPKSSWISFVGMSFLQKYSMTTLASTSFIFSVKYIPLLFAGNSYWNQ